MFQIGIIIPSKNEFNSKKIIIELKKQILLLMMDQMIKQENILQIRLII